MIWWRLFWWMFKRMALGGMVCGAAFGTLIFPILGTAFGLIYGAILGIATGLVSGLAVVLLTRYKFNPPQVSKSFQWWSAGVVVVSNAVLCPLLLIWLLSNVAALVVIPTLIASLVGGYFAYNFPIHAVRLYARKDLVEDDYPQKHKSPIVW